MEADAEMIKTARMIALKMLRVVVFMMYIFLVIFSNLVSSCDPNKDEANINGAKCAWYLVEELENFYSQSDRRYAQHPVFFNREGMMGPQAGYQ